MWINISPVANGYEMGITYDGFGTHKQKDNYVFTSIADLQAAIRNLVRDES